MFYSKFARDYEEIFPLHISVYDLLKDCLQKKGASILDVGCGTGHYCGRFANEGYEVTGIDLDENMISSAIKSYDQARFQILDVRKISSLQRKFDLVYSTGNVMAHISPEEFSVFLADLKGRMKPRSIWVFQVVNWDYVLGFDEMKLPLIETSGKTFRREYKNISTRSVLFRTELLDKHRNESLFEDEVTLYPVRAEEYIDLHKKAGFSIKAHYGDFQGGEPERNRFAPEIFIFTPDI